MNKINQPSRKFSTFIIIIILIMTYITPVGVSAQKGTLNCPPFQASRINASDLVKAQQKECRAEYKQLNLSQKFSVSQIIPLTSGGPDDYGYTYDDSVSYNWINASNNTGVTGDDNSSSLFGIGFDFPFYGVNYSQLYFSTNGLITFDQEYLQWGGDTIPNTGSPNNFIASFWDDLVVGSPDNSGGIYYESGGVSPNRYLVLEWRNITTYFGSDPFSFEVILYENGDILIQHQSLPAEYYSTVGIENSIGDDGLQYQVGGTGLSVPKAIKISYPTTPTARLLVSPLSSGKFASTSADTNFPLTITNNGSAGADTYDLTAISSWSVGLYQDGCVTPLSDTDTDTKIDTGLLPEGSSITICVKFTSLGGLDIGDANSASLTITSSLNATKTKNVSFDMAIPTSFVHVFEDYSDAAMAFSLVQPDGILTNYVTSDYYYGNGLATTILPDGRYLYAWRKPDGSYPDSFSDIEFTFVSDDGTSHTSISKLTSNAGTGQTYDYQPMLAVTPDGTIGVTWYRMIVDNSTGQYNFNIYFATMSDTGSLLYGPVNITSNNLWDDFDNINVPHFFETAIAGTDDNRFVVSWEDYRTDGTSTYNTNIWYTTFESTGASIIIPSALTTDNESSNPTINSLSNGNVVLTWTSYVLSPSFEINPTYSVINSNGSITKATTTLEIDSFFGPSIDAVLLPNGNVAIALAKSYGISLFILDTDYNILSGPHYASTQHYLQYGMSVTYDSSNRIIMSWWDEESYPPQNLFYALADDTGTFLTNPIPYRSSADGMITSENGQGIAPHIPPIVFSISRAGANPTFAASVDFTVTFSEKVTGVDASDFGLTTTGVTGASIIGVSGTGLMRTVSVKTGSGSGTIRLDVVDDDSIEDTSNNPLGGIGAGNGDYSYSQTYLVIKEPTFGDVPASHPYWQYIEVLYANGLTNGCSTTELLYCPTMIMNRAQVAKFFMTVEYGGSYLPPSNTPLVFKDSWKINPWAKLWANDMYAKGLTNGCSASPLRYCPDNQVIREQVAKFGLSIKYGNAYIPPPATGTVFADLTDVNYWATAWAEQAYADGLVPACGTVGGKPKFCPYGKVDRGFAAFVIVTATGLLGP